MRSASARPWGRQHLRAAFLEPGDAAQHLLRRARAEARQLGESAVARGVLELLQGVDAQPFVDAADARGPEPRHAHHLEESFGRALAQAVEQLGVAGLAELLEDLDRLRARSDAGRASGVP
jgi:hypothetical protein